VSFLESFDNVEALDLHRLICTRNQYIGQADVSASLKFGCLHPRRGEGNSDLSFSFSRFCFLIPNNGRRRTPRALAQAPIRGGAFGGVDGGVACECASRVADSHAADAQGGWVNGSRGG